MILLCSVAALLSVELVCSLVDVQEHCCGSDLMLLCFSGSGTDAR